jgi:hypothetical protein
MKYASGAVWFGEGALFGAETNYGQAEAKLDFFIEGTQVVGHTVELIPRKGGNLKSTWIRPLDF